MLRSMKQKFGSKTTKGNSVSRDDLASQQNSRQASASTSGISGRAGSISRNNSLPVREKIPQPSLDPPSAQQYYADTLPSFRDVPNSEKQALFIKKLHLCAFTFDFTDQSKSVREKEVKRQTLLELADYINQKDGAKFTDSVAEDVIFMLNNICSELCRRLSLMTRTIQTLMRRSPLLSQPGHTCRYCVLYVV